MFINLCERKLVDLKICVQKFISSLQQRLVIKVNAVKFCLAYRILGGSSWNMQHMIYFSFGAVPFHQIMPVTDTLKNFDRVRGTAIQSVSVEIALTILIFLRKALLYVNTKQQSSTASSELNRLSVSPWWETTVQDRHVGVVWHELLLHISWLDIIYQEPSYLPLPIILSLTSFRVMTFVKWGSYTSNFHRAVRRVITWKRYTSYNLHFHFNWHIFLTS